MRRHVANFANFICKFGEKDLIDYAESIVVPAFLDDSLIRRYGKTTFILYDVKFITLDESVKPPIIGLTGLFVKDTELTREQLFDRNKGLVKDAQSMRSSPSAFFLLILNNHRLIYFPQTTHPPSLDMFRSTVLWCLKRKHREFLKDQHSDLKGATKNELSEIHPPPALDVIPISGDEEIKNFIERYDRLRRIDFRISRTNDEIDGESLFDDVREYLGSDLGAKQTKVTVNNPEGLDKVAAIERVEAATATGNQEIVLSGYDSEGNQLKGDNHAFRVSSPLHEVPETRVALTRRLFEAFQHLLDTGVIRIGLQTRNISTQIDRLRNLF